MLRRPHPALRCVRATTRILPLALVALAFGGSAGIFVATADARDPQPDASSPLNATALPWPDFRGPNRNGHAPSEATPPITWSETDNVRFRTAIPGTGWSSPVVGEGKVWMTSARNGGRERLVVAVDSQSGAIVHERVLFEVEEPEPKNRLNSYASPSPALAPGRVFVHFGSLGTACLDAKTGATIWERRDLPCDHEQGPGASPVLVDDLLIVNLDGVDRQYAVALDAATGATRWETPRSADLEAKPKTMRKAYSTPIVVTADGRRCLISSGAVATYAYDPATGAELWSVEHGGFSMSSRPIANDEFLYLNTGYMKPRLVAVRLDGPQLDRDPAALETAPDAAAARTIEWSNDDAVPAMASPILVGERIYMANEKGILAALSAKTGETIYRKRVGRNFYASPVYAGGHLYFLDRGGNTVVIAPGDGDEPSIIAENPLEDGCMASPAVVGDTLFLRTETHLVRIETDDPDEAEETSLDD